ncbi:Peroxin-3-domain-containing protein [Crassisporium funariophilum]|nr:Peroxin-3-domain-containing protein [Crassisporium funariophilum]
MLESVKGLVYHRRQGISKVVGFAGAFYLAKRYLNERLEEVKDKLEQESAARDSLRRRFLQTQEDVSYTILALLPTLSEQILEQMDVEALTQELQTRSRARRQQISPHPQQLQFQRPPSSLASSIDLVQEQDTRSDVDSALVRPLETSGLQSWVESTSSAGSHSPARSLAASSAESLNGEGQLLSESMITTTTDSSANGESASIDGSGLSESMISTSAVSDTTDSRTKAELWNEVKILTFTRTLTTLYSTTLLCLLTTLQLTLLARSKYVSAVLQLEREERMRERFEDQFSMSNLLLGRGKGLEELLAGGDMSSLLGMDEDEDLGIDEVAENKYLTLSWWLLHVGWKDVGERVRRGVEEVFDGVSLKTKLAPVDLHRLVCDVRRRVEHEITFEGTQRKTTFLSSLLPPTPETIHHVLTQGGFASTHPYPASFDPRQGSSTSLSSSQISHVFGDSPALGLSNMHPHRSQPHHHHHPSSPPPLPTYLLPPPPPDHQQDPQFNALLSETRSILASADFARVLEVALDRATEVLFLGLEKNVFVDTATPDEGIVGEEVRIRLAGLLPGLTRWSELALAGLPNELVDNILAAREVSCLSAIAFAKFEERFR